MNVDGKQNLDRRYLPVQLCLLSPISLQRSERNGLTTQKQHKTWLNTFIFLFFFLDVSGLSEGRPSWTSYAARSSVWIFDSEKPAGVRHFGNGEAGCDDAAWTSPSSVVHQVSPRATQKNENEKRSESKQGSSPRKEIIQSVIAWLLCHKEIGAWTSSLNYRFSSCSPRLLSASFAGFCWAESSKHELENANSMSCQTSARSAKRVEFKVRKAQLSEENEDGRVNELLFAVFIRGDHLPVLVLKLGEMLSSRYEEMNSRCAIELRRLKHKRNGNSQSNLKRWNKRLLSLSPPHSQHC